jgi:hypothetical protein
LTPRHTSGRWATCTIVFIYSEDLELNADGVDPSFFNSTFVLLNRLLRATILSGAQMNLMLEISREQLAGKQA